MRLTAPPPTAATQPQNDSSGLDAKRIGKWAAFSVIPGATASLAMMSGSWSEVGDKIPVKAALKNGAKVAGLSALALTAINVNRDLSLPENSMAALGAGAGIGFGTGAALVLGATAIIDGADAFKGAKLRPRLSGAVVAGTVGAVISAFAGRQSPDRKSLPF